MPPPIFCSVAAPYNNEQRDTSQHWCKLSTRQEILIRQCATGALPFAVLALPPGSLPSLFDGTLSAVWFFAVLLAYALIQPARARTAAFCSECLTRSFFFSLAAALFSTEKRTSEACSVAGPTWLLAGAWGLLAVYAWHRGIPGAIGGFDTFVATPLWGTMHWTGRTGLACLAVTLCSIAPYTAFRSPQDHWGEAAFSLLWYGVLVCLFFPWTLVSCFGDIWLFAPDFFLFWGKIAVLALWISPYVAKKIAPRASVLLLLTGFLCILFEIMKD